MSVVTVEVKGGVGAADVLVVLVVAAAARKYVKSENWKDNVCISRLVLVVEEPAVLGEAGGCDSATALQASFGRSLEMKATMQAMSASALGLMLYEPQYEAMNACENGKRTNTRVMACVGAMKGVGHPNSCIATHMM